MEKEKIDVKSQIYFSKLIFKYNKRPDLKLSPQAPQCFDMRLAMRFCGHALLIDEIEEPFVTYMQHSKQVFCVQLELQENVELACVVCGLGHVETSPYIEKRLHRVVSLSLSLCLKIYILIRSLSVSHSEQVKLKYKLGSVNQRVRICI